MSESNTNETMSDYTIMTTGGIKQRMNCRGGMASTIESEFVTVEQLLDAVESDQPLTDTDGIGPKTARTIFEWYDNRFDREESASQSTVKRTSSSSLNISFHKSWKDALEGRR